LQTQSEQAAGAKITGLLDIIGRRFSPRSFSPERIDPEVLNTIITAASFAPSAYNEQPWRYRIFFRQTEDHDRLLEVLADGNREWARNAPVLILGFSKKHLDRNGLENRYAMYDLGQSVAYLSLQAMQSGLYTHQMGGCNRQGANEIFKINDEYEPQVVIALGRLDDNLLMEISPESVSSRRKRKAFNQVIV